MKVLVISNMYPDKKHPSYGIFVKKFCNQLSSIGIEYYKSVMFKADSKISKIINYILFYINSIYKILFFDYDLIYIHYASHSSLPVLLTRFLRKKKIYVNVHGSDVVPENNKQKKSQKITKKILEVCDKIIVPSEYFLEYTAKKYNLKSEKFIIYPSAGVDSKVFYIKNRNHDSKLGSEFENIKTFGFVGRISEGKGWDTFIDSIEIVFNNNTEFNSNFIIIGDGPQSNNLEALLRSKNLEHKVIFEKNLLPQNELSNFFNKLDFLVFPTRREGESLGLVALESMACGTPVISSDFAAPSYYITDSLNGYKFNLNDPESLAEVIVKANSIEINKYKRMVDSAYYTASRYFEENIIDDFRSIFYN